MQNSKTILITGIGGNVGQGIIRNLLASEYNVRLVGSNVSIPTVANYLCHKVYKVPYAYEEGYIERIREICNLEKVDLIIPSTDYETLYLSRHSDRLPKVAAINAEVSEILIDKYKTFNSFVLNNIPFAESYLPSEYKGQFKNIIVKPREGRGSRGIEINPENVQSFDDSFVIQELLVGKEITTAFYIDLSGKCISHISMERALENGTTIFTKVVDYLDLEIEGIISKMVKSFEIRGACNIQFIYTEDEQIIPFEINGRISGTNSIRSNFGFTDVLWTIQELLYQKKIEKPILRKGVATRILVDVIYENYTEFEQIDNKVKYYIF